jgi:hypothetical protein|tara:strand:+ start:8058 stop:8264 length:207 start_codon:yes stop_codon:yes gene_type:complete
MKPKTPKVVDLKAYKQDKKMKEWIEELDRFAEDHYKTMSPTEKKGYDNFMRLIRAVDKMPREGQETKE